MRVTAKITIYAGGTIYPPGSVVLIEDETEALSLIARGFATEAPAEPVTQKPSKKAK